MQEACRTAGSYVLFTQPVGTNTCVPIAKSLVDKCGLQLFHSGYMHFRTRYLAVCLPCIMAGGSRINCSLNSIGKQNT